MSGRYGLSPLAQGDIERIWIETANKWGVDQAETYIRQVSDHIQIIADRPLLGRACLDVRTGYYKYPTGSHILFYRRAENGIDVMRILHERMDLKRHV